MYKNGIHANKIDVELLHTHLSPPPIPAPSNICLIVAFLSLCPAQPRSSYVLSVFVSSFKSNIFNHRNVLTRTNGVSTTVAREQTRDNQRPWTARCTTYWPDAHTKGKTQTWKGSFGNAKIHAFPAVVISPP